MTSKLGFSVVASDQYKLTALDVRQQKILLSFVEAMDLIEKQYSGSTGFRRRLDDLPNVFFAR
jgi:hypothetical protein